MSMEVWRKNAISCFKASLAVVRGSSLDVESTGHAEIADSRMSGPSHAELC
jgi:hypothetical protein